MVVTVVAVVTAMIEVCSGAVMVELIDGRGRSVSFDNICYI